MVGLEPTTFEVEARRSIQLSYIPKAARVEGLEPTTSASEAQRSIQLSYTPINLKSEI